MSTHNIGFNEDLTKIIFQFQIPSKTHLISHSGSKDTSCIMRKLFYGVSDQVQNNRLYIATEDG